MRTAKTRQGRGRVEAARHEELQDEFDRSILGRMKFVELSSPAARRYSMEHARVA